MSDALLEELMFANFTPVLRAQIFDVMHSSCVVRVGRVYLSEVDDDKHRERARITKPHYLHTTHRNCALRFYSTLAQVHSEKCLVLITSQSRCS